MLYKHLTRFAIAGSVATVFAMFSFPLIYEELFGRKFFNLAYIISCLFNVILSFLLQRIFVFQSKKRLIREFFKFALGAVFLMLLGYVVVYFFVEYMAFNPYLINIAVVSITSIASFLWHKFITFGVKS